METTYETKEDVMAELINSGQIDQKKMKWSKIEGIVEEYCLIPLNEPVLQGKYEWISRERFEELVEKALANGRAELENPLEVVLSTETDGGTEIYYEKYQRSFIYQGKIRISLSIEETPKLDIQCSGKTEWGPWQ